MLLIILLFASVLAFKPLNSATIYIDSTGDVTYMPNNCTVHCPPSMPTCGVVKCTLVTLPDCSYTDFYKTVDMVGFYTVPPEKACDRDTILISKPGSYRIYIDSYGTVLRMSVQNTLQPVDNTTSVLFTLGYIY